MEAMEYDRLYLNEDYKIKPKENFKFVMSEIKKDFPDFSGSLIDVGCATGDFLHYLHTETPNVKLAGLDISKCLLNELNKPIDIGITSIEGDISSESFISKEKYDVVTMLGVINRFENFILVIDNLLKLVRKDGFIYIVGNFNPDDIDCIIKYKPSTNNSWITDGYGVVYSIKTISSYLETVGKTYSFLKFTMPFEIKKHEGDPMRNWTINLNGNIEQMNGLQMIKNFYLLKIKK